MKDSGIDWIGEMPKHWKSGNGKAVFSIYGGSISDDELSLFEVNNWDKILYFKVEDMNSTELGFEMVYEKEMLFTLRKNRPLNAPLILVPKRGGAIYTNKVRITNRNCLIDPNIMALAAKGNIKFYAYLVRRKNVNRHW